MHNCDYRTLLNIAQAYLVFIFKKRTKYIENGAISNRIAPVSKGINAIPNGTQSIPFGIVPDGEVSGVFHAGEYQNQMAFRLTHVVRDWFHKESSKTKWHSA